MQEPLAWVCLLLVAALGVAGAMLRGQRREIVDKDTVIFNQAAKISALRAEVAKMDGDGDGHIGGSRSRR